MHVRTLDDREGWVILSQREVSFRASPGRGGEVMDVLEYPVRVTLLELVTVDSPAEPNDSTYWHGDMWERVRLDDGREGWIFLHGLSFL